MRVLIYIAIHQREEIRDQVITGLKKFINAGFEKGIESRLFLIYSLEEDIIYWRNNIQVDYIQQAENRPLGQKFNSGLTKVFSIDFDWFLQSGCDDILDPVLWDRFLERKEEGEVLGCTNLKVIEQKTGRTKNINANHIFGAGRFIRSDILKNTINCYEVIGKVSDTSGVRRGREMIVSRNNFNQKIHQIIGPIYNLYDDWRDSAMDANSQRNMNLRNNNELRFIKIDGDDYLVTDIKTDANINSYDKLK